MRGASIGSVKGMEELAVSNFSDKLTEQWQDTASLVLGLWLLISPWLLGYAVAPAIAWNAYVVGVIVVVAAGAALITFQKWEEWLKAALGAWLVLSPWVLTYGAFKTAMWNHVVVGALVLILAIWSATTTEHRMVTKG